MSLYDKASLIMTPSGVKSAKIYSKKPFNANGDFTFDRSTVATRVNKDGLIETVAIDTPRLDYPLIDGVVQDCPSLLLEPARTNSITYSEDFSQYSYGGTAPTLTTGQLAPDGTYNATKVSGVIGSTSLYKNLESSTTASRSIYARTVSGTGTARLTSYNSNANNLFLLTEEWQRFELTGSSSTGGENFYAADFRGSQTLSEFIIWGAQSEEGSYATSYIPTSGSTVTRAAETANGAGTSAEFNDSEGVLYAEMSKLNNSQSGSVIWSVSDGSNSNAVSIYYGNTGVSVDIFNSLGVKTLTNPMSLSLQGNINKCAIKYKSTDISLWVNGFEGAVNTDAISLTGLNQIVSSYGSGSFPFYGKTKELSVFKEALTDSELESLTSWDSFSDMATGQEYSIR